MDYPSGRGPAWMTAARSGDVGRASRCSVPFCPYSVGTRAQNSGCWGPRAPHSGNHLSAGQDAQPRDSRPTEPHLPNATQGHRGCAALPLRVGPESPVRCSPSIYIRLGTSPLSVYSPVLPAAPSLCTPTLSSTHSPGQGHGPRQLQTPGVLMAPF